MESGLLATAPSIDDIGSCLEQVVCLRDGSMLVQEASSIGERIICDFDDA
jgi:hypothetical protein